MDSKVQDNTCLLYWTFSRFQNINSIILKTQRSDLDPANIFVKPKSKSEVQNPRTGTEADTEGHLPEM